MKPYPASPNVNPVQLMSITVHQVKFMIMTNEAYLTWQSEFNWGLPCLLECSGNPAIRGPVKSDLAFI